MILWRISNHGTLDGGGGLRAAGRWHSRGRRIVYCSPNPATALLEIMVHLEVEVEDIPMNFRYLQIEAPDVVSRETADIRFPDVRWKTQVEVTRRIGDEWLNSGRSALLLVPCVIVPATTNLLINPEHHESDGIRISRIHDQPIDARLLRS